MTDTPKSKVEDIARRRKWMGRIRSYLIVVLMGLAVIALNVHDLHQRSALIIGFLSSMSTIYVFVLRDPNDEPPPPMAFDHHVESTWIIFCLMGGVIVTVLVDVFLPRLGG